MESENATLPENDIGLYEYRGAISKQDALNAALDEEDEEDPNKVLNKLLQKNKRKTIVSNKSVKKAKKSSSIKENGPREVIQIMEETDPSIMRQPSAFAQRNVPALANATKLVRQSSDLSNQIKMIRSNSNSVARQPVDKPNDDSQKEVEETKKITLAFKSRVHHQIIKVRAYRVDKFSNILAAFCKNYAVSSAYCQLKYQGMFLKLHETPEDYAMADDDQVEVLIQGDSSPASSPIASYPVVQEGVPLDAKADEGSVKLKVRSGNKEERFKLGKDDQFQKLFDAFCSRVNLPNKNVKFMFDGRVLDPRSTPEALDMEDDDLIDAVTS